MAQAATQETIDWPWPFSQADLSAGLRRYYSDPSIWVREVRPITLRHIQPSIGRLRAARVTFRGKAGEQQERFVVKEPRGTTRTGLAGAGRREVGVYRHLVSELPMRTPRMVAASDSGDWLVLEARTPLRPPARWTIDDYESAMRALAELHDRFWGLGEDLGVYPWLSRPTEADFSVHVTAAANSLQRIVDRGQPAGVANWSEKLHTLAHLILHADQIIEPLRQEPATLLHGDYWPGNILVHEGGQLVFDWQLTAVGPAVLDVVAFVLKTEWWFERMPLSADGVARLYRRSLQEKSGQAWEEGRWQQLWDHAVMWRFLQEWLDLFAASPDTLLETRAADLERLWFGPLARAARRLLGD
jgi:hypothetical protein